MDDHDLCFSTAPLKRRDGRDVDLPPPKRAESNITEFGLPLPNNLLPSILPNPYDNPPTPPPVYNFPDFSGLDLAHISAPVQSFQSFESGLFSSSSGESESISFMPLILPTLPLPPPEPEDPRAPMWSRLETLLVRIGFTPLPPGDSWFGFFKSIQLEYEPNDFTVDVWSKNQFDVVITYAAEPAPKTISVINPTDVIPSDHYLMWDEMQTLQRLYYLFCVEKLVEREKTEEEPSISSWSFQFLLITLLRGSSSMQVRAAKLLMQIEPHRWCDRYLFAGGFFRRELVKTTAELSPFLVSMVQMLLEQDGHEGHISDWVAFFEQVENFDAEYAALRARFPPSIRMDVKREMFDQPDLKVRSGIFESVVFLGASTVTVKYYGCPRTVQLALDKIKSPRILRAIDTWQCTSPSQ